MTLSIIVPVLNEAPQLPLLLARLLLLIQHGHEVIIVDGGSVDGSAELAQDAGLTVVHATGGRAGQMNAGATHATGAVLLFLHADTQLPDDAAGLIDQALSGNKYRWGRFDVSLSGHHTMLRVVGCMMNWRSRLTGIATGDQAIFICRSVFVAVGGFPDQPLMEDIEISRRLRKVSRPACISHRVITSGRRWETHGVWRTIVLMWCLRWLYWAGVPASQLARAYR